MGSARAYFTTAEGGAAVDRCLRVFDEAISPIAGLYTVGQNGLGGLILWGHGLHISWALANGRLAGVRSLGDRLCQPKQLFVNPRLRFLAHVVPPPAEAWLLKPASGRRSWLAFPGHLRSHGR